MNTTTATKLTTPRALTAVLLLQGLILVGQWTGQPSSAAARAEGRGESMDPAAQRQQTVDELKSVNTKLDRVVSLLEAIKDKSVDAADKK
jgi:hypothetical protein